MLWSKTPSIRKSYSQASGSHSKITPAPRKWGCRMFKNGCPYSDLSLQPILMILVSKFLHSCLVYRTILKIEKLWIKRVKNDQKTKYGTSIPFLPQFSSNFDDFGIKIFVFMSSFYNNNKNVKNDRSKGSKMTKKLNL